MVSRPAAAPKQQVGSESVPLPPPAPAEEIQENPSDFSDFDLDGSSLDFHVDAESGGETDPVDALAEEAAVLFANGQDSETREILENALKSQQSEGVERLWLMLFDLYRLSGQRPAFEAAGIEYARACEKSPPGWGAESEPAEKAKTAKSGSMLFKGDLLGSNGASFAAAGQALEKKPTLRLDMAKVKQADPEGCARLLKLLSPAGKGKRAIEILGRDVLVPLVKDCIAAGKAETPASGKECWLLLLELFQQQGQQDLFEDLAIDYAVTFEESPPSWEFEQIAEPEPAMPEPGAESADEEEEEEGAYVLSGEIKSLRFGDLPEFAQGRDRLLIDCRKLVRIDFVSAGVLLNVLTTLRSADNTPIVFRYPNHLVAELFRVVGLGAMTTIVFAKH